MVLIYINDNWFEIIKFLNLENVQVSKNSEYVITGEPTAINTSEHMFAIRIQQSQYNIKPYLTITLE